jgi:hypothetical protein
MSRPKGMALPIETIVVLTITVLVLTVVIAFFVGGSSKPMAEMNDLEAFGKGCTQLALSPYFCDPAKVDTVKIPNYGGKSLYDACKARGFVQEGVSAEEKKKSCAQACRCPV